MNAQQQDIIRLLTARGPMTSRELFDVMQDELGYYGFAANHDQIQRAVESLSKILSKMKSENLIYGSMTAQPKGRPVMVWSAPTADGYIAGVDEVPEYDTENDFVMMTETPAIPDDEHSEMASDITELSSSVDDFAIYPQPSSHLLIMTDSTRILSGDKYEMTLHRAYPQLHVCLSGELEIHNRAELAQVIGAIERMLP